MKNKPLKVIILFLISLLLSPPAYAQFDFLKKKFGNIVKGSEETIKQTSLSDTDIGQGLKEALKVGINNTVSSVGKAGGYFNFWGVGLLVHGAVYKEFLANRPVKKKDNIGSKVNKLTKKLPFQDKIDSLKKRARLISHDREEKQIPDVAKTPKINGIKAPSKSIGKTKIAEKSDLLEPDLTEQEKVELKKTESEVDVEEKVLICVVHKGPITGTIYNCPKCKTFYCLKCAQTLEEKGENCWSCNEEVKV